MGNPAWRTLIYSILTFGKMACVPAVRTGNKSLFYAGVMNNHPLLGALLLTCAVQLAVINTPFLQGVYKTARLHAGKLAPCFAQSSVLF